MDLSWLDVLRERLATEDDLGAVVHAFHDRLDEAPGFFELGRAVRDPMLERLVAEAARSALALERPPRLQAVRLLRVAEKRFVHGALTIEGRAGQLLWFEETGRGLLVLADLATMQTTLTRITASVISAEDGSRN